MMTMKNSIITNAQLTKTIEDHLGEDLSVAFLAKCFHYSEFYFSRLFKEQMGISVMDYVCKRRLVIATEKILEGKNIIDVAMEYGWQSHSGFSKAFKKEYGFSPSLLKAMLLELENQGGSTMKSNFLEKTEEHASKEQLIQVLKGHIEQNKIENNDNLNQMIQYADVAYDGILRYSGDAYITHTLHVAIILAQLEMDINTIEAGLFCDVAKKSSKPLNEILSVLPIKVANIIEEIANADACVLSQLSEPALLVKVVERLHNMRTLEYMDR